MGSRPSCKPAAATAKIKPTTAAARKAPATQQDMAGTTKPWSRVDLRELASAETVPIVAVFPLVETITEVPLNVTVPVFPVPGPVQLISVSET